MFSLGGEEMLIDSTLVSVYNKGNESQIISVNISMENLSRG